MSDIKNFKSYYSAVNGIRMYYEIHGNKDHVLVLIHGGGSTINSSFSRLIPMLAVNYTVIAMELQAHGRTNDRDAAESFEQDADDVACLLNNLDISKVSFLGFSNGGNTAIQIANRHPQLVNKLILASTFYKREGFPRGFFEGMQQATINDMPQSLKDEFLKLNPDRNSLLNMFNKDRERMLNFTDWKDEMLSSIQAPTLIINGDRDVISTEHALQMSKLIGNCRLLIVPAMHGEFFGVAESPQPGNKLVKATADLIEDFLEM